MQGRAQPPAANPDDGEAAFEKAVRVLNAASQTADGLTRKLRRAGYSAGAAAQAVARATSLGYVDDRAYAQALVERRLRMGRGRGLIGQELAHKGLEDAVVGEALQGVDAGTELAAATSLAIKLLRRHRAEADDRARQKVLAGLARRGFSSALARKAMENTGSVQE